MFRRPQNLFLYLLCLTAGIVFCIGMFASLKPAVQHMRRKDSNQQSTIRLIRNGSRSSEAIMARSTSEVYAEDSDDTRGNFTFPLNSRHRCFSRPKTNNSTLRVAIAVISKPDNFEQRLLIRKTWGQCEGCQCTLKIVFLVGATVNKHVHEQLVNESSIYRDVVQVNLTDEYHLLVYKSIAMLEWFYRYCRYADIFIKVDDDTYFDIKSVINAISKLKEDRFFYCSVFIKAKPIRKQKSKWYVAPEVYSGAVYPPYCSGPGYGFSSNILSDLYRSALTSKPMPMEDVFITGISAQKLNITYIHSPQIIYLWRNKKIDCRLKNWYLIHHVDLGELQEIYSFLKQNKCE